MAYTFNFVSRSNVNYSNKEKEKKRKKWYMIIPLSNSRFISRNLFFGFLIVVLFFLTIKLNYNKCNEIFNIFLIVIYNTISFFTLKRS
jgi:hypothetical protein